MLIPYMFSHMHLRCIQYITGFCLRHPFTTILISKIDWKAAYHRQHLNGDTAKKTLTLRGVAQPASGRGLRIGRGIEGEVPAGADAVLEGRPGGVAAAPWLRKGRVALTVQYLNAGLAGAAVGEGIALRRGRVCHGIVGFVQHGRRCRQLEGELRQQWCSSSSSSIICQCTSGSGNTWCPGGNGPGAARAARC